MFLIQIIRKITPNLSQKYEKIIGKSIHVTLMECMEIGNRFFKGQIGRSPHKTVQFRSINRSSFAMTLNS